MAVFPGAQSRDCLLRSHACDHDQFPASVEGLGTRDAQLHMFHSIPTSGVFLSVSAAGTQLRSGEGKRESETPLMY